MTDTELMQKLREDHDFNPWLDAAGGWLRDFEAGNTIDNFILLGDEEAVKNHNEAAREWCEKSNEKTKDGSSKFAEDFQLHRDLMPQPFIGNPHAPVWVLLTNPGYSEADVYDLKSVDEGRGKLAAKSARVRILKVPDLTAEVALNIRRKLVCKQLKFESGDDAAFYILRREFKTIEGNGMTVWGGYNWYMKYFACAHSYVASINDCLKDLSRNVFVVEYVPYHSKQYFESKQRFVHHNLWEKLITHGLESKIMIMRGSLYKKITDIVKPNDDLKNKLFKAEAERRIVVFKGQSANLTPANTYWPCSFSREVNPLLRIMS